MGRAYEMIVTVRNWTRGREEDIHAALVKEWNFDVYSVYHGLGSDGDANLFFSGVDNLTAGEGEKEFARRVTFAAWRANRGYCDVFINEKFLEEPFETYLLDEEDYDEWKEKENAP